MRRAIRRWLGVPTSEEMRAQILREIDADRAWQDPRPDITPARQMSDLAVERRVAIAMQCREDTRG